MQIISHEDYMFALTLRRAELFENIEKSLISTCLPYERSLHAKFQAFYGLGCGIIGTFSLYIEIIIIIYVRLFMTIRKQ
jgi:hypothetical protein